ncbi:MAG: DUF992 domain-containing protein [Alphaproteobacteria bacterium]|nr:DUF992 domain-containing protein [Alphaproteobacteria bacterium]
MNIRNRVAAAAIAAIGAAGALAAPASAASGVAVGVLNCNVAGGWGLVFGSSRDLNCVLTGTNGVQEQYTGQINRFGVDLGYTQASVMLWTVVAPQANLQPGALNGAYAGGTASATVGLGLGANALIGGGGNTIALQPLSIQGSTGLNVAGGIAALTLAYHP